MFATIRSGPLAIAFLLLAGSAGLGWLLWHDAVGADHSLLAEAAVGDTVQAKGYLQPYVAPPGTGSPARWAPVMSHLGNVTYILQNTSSDLMVLVTADAPNPVAFDGQVVVTGIETLRIAHPDQSWRTLVLIRVTNWNEPLVFR